jgi:hypothetical protein
MPRCTDAAAPTNATVSPSTTAVPARTASEPSCVSDTVYPSAVRMLSVGPFPGVVPANATAPVAGAPTGAPGFPATSIPRRCPRSYGCARSNENVRSTSPLVGHDQASARAGRTNRTTARPIVNERTQSPLVLSWLKTHAP